MSDARTLQDTWDVRCSSSMFKATRFDGAGGLRGSKRFVNTLYLR